MQITIARRRRKPLLAFVVLFALAILLSLRNYCALTFTILVKGPFINWWATNHLRISTERDEFDVNFASYPDMPSTELDRTLPVPPIIHHISLGSLVNSTNLSSAVHACRAMHPQYDFKFWGDGEAREFVARSFPHLLGMWNSYRYVIQRADSLRYMILYVYGGVFLDLDLMCLRPLDPLRQFDFVAPAATPMGISNGFMMVSPRHPFMKSVVEFLPLYNINWFGIPYATVMFSTGCHYLSTMLALFPNNQNLRILWGPNRLHQLSGDVTTPLFRHFGMSSWHAADGAFFKLFRPGHEHGPFGVTVTYSFSSTLIIFVFLGIRRYRRRIPVPHKFI